MRRLLFSCPLLILAGCGGGSGGTNVIPLSPSVAQFQNGWNWTYSFSGTFTPVGGSAFEATGTRTINCSVASAGAVSLTENTSITANGTSYTHSKLLAYTQGGDGSLALTSETTDSNPSETVLKSTFVQPGKISSTTNLNGLITFQDSTSESDSFNVTGIDLVPTAVGKFSTWVVSRTISYQGQPVLSVSEYLAPGIGEPVKLTGTWTANDGSYTGTFILASATAGLPNLKPR